MMGEVLDDLAPVVPLEIAEPPRRAGPRSVIERTCDKTRFRVLKESLLGHWLMPIGVKSDWCEYRKGLLNDLIAAGEYSLVPHSQVVRPALAPHDQQTANKRWANFGPSFGDLDRLLRPEGRAAVFEELKAKVARGLCWVILRRWLEGDKTASSLAVPTRMRTAVLATLEAVKDLNLDLARKQVRNQCERLLNQTPLPVVKPDFVKGKGTPRKRKAPTRRTRFDCSDLYVQRLFVHYFEQKLAGGSATTLRSVYEAMLENEFSIFRPYGNSERFPDYVLPTFKSFEGYFNRYFGKKARKKAEVGGHEFELNHRDLRTNDATPSMAAGAEGQIDATVWNVMIVTDDKYRLPCGYAVVFRVRCTNSGRLLGLGISLESASWLGAASAIVNCLVPKRIMFAQHGLRLDGDQFAFRGMPPKLRADCGELFNNLVRRFERETGVWVHCVPPARGDLKGGVESDFFVLQVPMNGLTPSALIDQYERQEKTKWVAKAHLTLRQFTRMLLRQELIRDEAIRPGKRLPVFLAGSGISNDPRTVWHALETQRETALLDLDPTKVQLAAMWQGEGREVGEGRIVFDHVHYVINGPSDAATLKRARDPGKKKLNVAFDERCANRVYLVLGDKEHPEGHIQCDLDETREDQRGMRDKSFRELKVLRDNVEAANERHAQETLQRQRALRQEQEEEVTTSQAEQAAARAAFPLNGRQLLNLLPAAKQLERDRTTPATAFQPQLAGAAPPAAVAEAAPTPSTSSVPVNAVPLSPPIGSDVAPAPDPVPAALSDHRRKTRDALASFDSTNAGGKP